MRGWPQPAEMNPFAPRCAIDALEEILERQRIGDVKDAEIEQRESFLNAAKKVRSTSDVDKIATEKTLRKLLEKEGLTIGAAARRLGIDCKGISFRAKKWGIVYRDQHGKTHYPPKEYKEQIKKAEEEKKRIKEAIPLIIAGTPIMHVAKSIGVSYQKMYRAVRGVPNRRMRIVA